MIPGPMPLATGLTVLGIVILILLGNWQMDRREWKLELIEAAETRAAATPIPLERALTLPPDEWEYRRVQATGRFDHENEAYVFSQLEGGRIGYQVITPFRTVEGRTILVDRGFVPEDKRAPETRPEGQVAGQQSVTGLLRVSQPAGFFTPAADEIARIWYTRDVEAMARALGVRVSAPLILAADGTPNPGGWPEGGHTRLNFRNDHLSYALTWYALAVVLTGVYLAYWFSRRPPRRK